MVGKYFEVDRINRDGSTGELLGIVKAKTKAKAATIIGTAIGLKNVRVFPVKVTKVK